jgi:HlyD family secretion protein
MDAELHRLQIERSVKGAEPRRGSVGWAIAALMAVLLAAGGYVLYARLHPLTEIEVVRVRPPESSTASQEGVALQATGYIIAAHKIEVASKVVGRVAWIGVEKGDMVRQGQVLVRLEDDEYRARVLEAQGHLESIRARLAELEHGSRSEEIARAAAELEHAQAELDNARVTLVRTRALATEGVLARQTLDDAQSRHAVQTARVASLKKAYELVRLGPRPEQIEAQLALVQQAKGVLAFAQTQLQNTVISAPISGTVLKRNVEKGEFVTTGFVGDRGAKGYVASLADLKDLEVEIDISQNDFAKLTWRQPAFITTDAYPDRKYRGYVSEISPEANRQKATLQIKVKIAEPDAYLRPEMNASVTFITREKPSSELRLRFNVPSSAIRDGNVFLLVDGKVAARRVQVAGALDSTAQITEGLSGNELLIVNPPANLRDGDKVQAKEVR